MKVTVCPICRVTPEITNTKLSCPKCGRTAVGKYLEDTVTKWNTGIVTNGKVTKEVIEEPEEPKEAKKPAKKAEKAPEKEPEKAPVKKTTKRGMK